MTFPTESASTESVQYDTVSTVGRERSMWYYEQSGTTHGPVAPDAIRRLIASGSIARSTQLWTEGLSGWMVAEWTEFGSAFQGAMPPRLPVPQPALQFPVAQPYAGYVSADPDHKTVNLVYILFIVGFFVHITALVGVIMAYVNRATANQVYRSHYDWQIKTFWTGLIAFAIMVATYVVSIVLAFFTFGLTLLTFPAIILAGIGWLVWTIFAIAKGMSALGRNAPVTIVGYW